LHQRPEAFEHFPLIVRGAPGPDQQCEGRRRGWSACSEPASNRIIMKDDMPSAAYAT
jgi:hypothetical protein